jgi:hypothetical protein
MYELSPNVGDGRIRRQRLELERELDSVNAMTNTNVLQFSQPGTFADPLTEVLRNGARALSGAGGRGWIDMLARSPMMGVDAWCATVIWDNDDNVYMLKNQLSRAP